MTDIADLFGEWLNSLQSGATDEIWTVAGPVPITPVAAVPQTDPDDMSIAINDSRVGGVAYCGDEVWTPEHLPQFPDRWEASSVTFIPNETGPTFPAPSIIYTYQGVEYQGVIVANSSETFTPSRPMQWYYGEPAGDAVCPDTSQPYFLDLIARIDELT